MVEESTAQIVRGYIDVVIWPATVLTVVGIAVFRFRQEIAQVILRIQSVKAPGGAEILAPLLQEQQAAGRPPEEIADHLSELSEQAHDELSNEAMAAIDEAYSAAAEEIEAVRAQLTQAQLDLYYERVYRLIWGTQIALLKELNELGPQSMAALMGNHFQEHLKRVRILTPQYVGDFGAYLNFLTSWGLIEFIQPASYQITTLGRGFLTYLTSNGISTAKFY